MNVKSPPSLLHQIQILDEDAYQRCDIEWLALAKRVIQQAKVKAKVLQQAPGLARFLNLVAWHPEDHLEYLDRHGLTGDMAIHIACHQAVHHRFGSSESEYRLLGEVLASATDIYLVGRFAQAGEEAAFLQDTLESYNYYYETYAALTDLENVLARAMDHPYATMLELAQYLYQFAELLLFNLPSETSLTGLANLAQNRFYPLVHHYHLANWIVTIGGNLPSEKKCDSQIQTIWSKLAEGESSFATLMQWNLAW